MRRHGRQFREWAERCAGFTLIEVITVAVIIGILLAVVFPAMTTARKNAKKRQAALETRLIADAIGLYRNTYGKWPLQVQDEMDTTYWAQNQTNLLYTLIRGNPRNMQFLEVDARSMTNGMFLDPWGHGYVIAVDENGDGHAMFSVKSFKVDGQELSLYQVASNKQVGVLSLGPTPSNTNTRIYSWQN